MIVASTKKLELLCFGVCEGFRDSVSRSGVGGTQHRLSHFLYGDAHLLGTSSGRRSRRARHGRGRGRSKDAVALGGDLGKSGVVVDVLHGLERVAGQGVVLEAGTSRHELL